MSAFPIYKSDERATVELSPEQQSSIDSVKQKIAAGNYGFVSVRCLCQQDPNQQDTIITEKDRYGFALNSIICGHCGLVRSEKIFDESSIISFYSDEYRKIYQPPGMSTAAFFDHQHQRGKVFLDLFTREVGKLPNASAFEIGCGAGGILFPFHNAGYSCEGADYNNDFLDYGRSKGMKLHLGDYHTCVAHGSKDIIILSHVLEHMTDPVKELNDIFEKLKVNGYLILEVPGIFHIHKGYFDPLSYFQNAHVYSFYKDYLVQMAHQLGFKIIYADERSTLILQKPADWQRKDKINLSSEALKGYPQKVKAYIYRNYVMNKYKLNYHYWRFLFFTTLRKLKLIK